MAARGAPAGQRRVRGVRRIRDSNACTADTAVSLIAEVPFSDRAPKLADFWDDSVSADALQPAVRKVVHLRAEEFVVQG